MKMSPSATYFSTESTETMRIKRLAQGHNILLQSGFKPSIAVSRNRHLTHMISMLRSMVSMVCERLITVNAIIVVSIYDITISQQFKLKMSM